MKRVLLHTRCALGTSVLVIEAAAGPIKLPPRSDRVRPGLFGEVFGGSSRGGLAGDPAELARVMAGPCSSQVRASVAHGAPGSGSSKRCLILLKLIRCKMDMMSFDSSFEKESLAATARRWLPSASQEKSQSFATSENIIVIIRV